MYDIRIHGRGGQGAVTAANMIARAAYYSNIFVRSFPLYGPERRGAPVIAFVRLNDAPIRIRSGIYVPDCIMVIDPKLPQMVNVTTGLRPGGMAILNSSLAMDELSFSSCCKTLVVVNATQIAKDMLGEPITNTVMLGAFAKAFHGIKMEAIIRAIIHTFGDNSMGRKNAAAAEAAFEQTVISIRNS